MSDGPATLSSPLLADYLQQLTETLAAAQTQEGVLAAALAPAMTSLGALAGAVLLLDARTRHLAVAALQGSQAQTVWQDGPLDQDTPAADALTSGKALYYEHAGTLKAAYPELEGATGGVTAVATAVLPLRLDGRALGVLILDFREPHEFTPDERRFLHTLATQSSVALDRVRLIAALQGQIRQRTDQLGRQTAELEAEQAARQAFVQFTEAASHAEDIGHLARLALDTLGRILPGSSGAFYTRTAGTWQPLSWTADLAPQQAAPPHGLTLEAAVAAQLLRTRRPVFVDGQPDGATGGSGAAGSGSVGSGPVESGTVAAYPVEQHTEVCAVLSVALPRLPRWSVEARALVQALGRSFSLLYERVAAAEQLRQQRAEAEGRERVLEVLAALTAEMGSHQEDHTLIRRAQEQVLDLLPLGHAAYWEPEGDVWRLRSYINEVRSAELMAQMHGGLPVGRTPTLDTPWTTGEPLYQSAYQDGTDLRRDLVTGISAVASLPVGQGAHRRGVINFTAFQPHRWSRTEQALLRTLAQGLGLALERASKSRQLEEERAGLAAFAAFTEAAFTEADVLTLARQAVAVLRANLPGISVAYYERAQERWVGRAWSADVPAEVVAQMRAGVAATAPDFAQAVRTGSPVFTESWNAAENDLPGAAMYGAAACVPLAVHGDVHSLLTAGFRIRSHWSDRERSIVRAVGQGLALALERAAAARQMQLRKEEAERRGQALEAFAVMSRDLAGETDRSALIRRAQEIMLSLLTPGHALYWEADGDRWHLKAQVGDLGDPDLQTRLREQGLPLDTPAFADTWRTGTPSYRDHAAPGDGMVLGDGTVLGDSAPGRPVQAATAFQIRLHGQPLGILAIGLFDQRDWTPMDRAVLETAVYSLGLVLERAQSIGTLADRTAELERANQELHAANEELEAFTYSASHDLRTPVRHVKGFTEMATRALDKGEADKARRHHQIVSEAADRMTALIDAMLVLSRAARAPIHLREVALATLVAQAQRDAQMEFPDRQVRWTVGTLPTVQADPQLLQQVLTNLLSNAVKYGQGRESVDVEVWATERPGEVQVFVRDHGAGFNPDYADKLFGVFQRLHRQEEFQGTGVGLATVRRLITRHGGRVWAEGRLGEGATFGFSLPR